MIKQLKSAWLNIMRKTFKYIHLYIYTLTGYTHRHNFQMFKLVLEKAGEPEIKLPTSAGSLKKQESSTTALLSTLKPLTVGSQ